MPAIVIAVLGWTWLPRWARTCSWRRLLLASYAVGLGWLLALALVDGPEGISRVLGHPSEYLVSAREVGSISTFLHEYVSRIPLDAPDNWPTQFAGHPPLAGLFFVALVRVGLGGDLAAGLVVVVIAATTSLAVLTTLRALGREQLARTAAPFVVLTPAAVFMAVSADAMFGAVTAWALACLAIAATHPDRRRLLAWSALAGLLFGAAVMLSYGLPLIGVVALAVLTAARSWWPLPVAAAVAALVVLGFAAGGFAWWEAYPVLHDRYWDGIAASRPASYWMWGNLAALLVSAGPALGAGLGHVGTRWRSLDRTAVLLVAGATVAVVAADLSRMSKAEVERIWLPFMPWLTLSLVLLPAGARRWALGLQLVTALVVQQLLYTSW
ncbi:unannotated protein [freshwater metagenome]|uniref:Unannotated protein n=1 Tax=freshwater metagenome TaxID=449393 RepID=A0A6J6QCN3_9ZZZZ